MFVAHTFDLDPFKSFFSLPRFEITKTRDKVILKINCWKDENPEEFLTSPFQLENLSNEKEEAEILDWRGRIFLIGPNGSLFRECSRFFAEASKNSSRTHDRVKMGATH